MSEAFISETDLDALDAQLEDRRQHVRSENGFERPLYVSPATWDQVMMIVKELKARRRGAW